MANTAPTKLSAVPILGGIVYFVAVFAVGFMLGVLRTVMVQEAAESERLLAVLLELPIIISASWFLCRIVIQWFQVPHVVMVRVAMGGTALVFLLAAEFILDVMFMGHTPAEHFTLYAESSYAIGLAGQILFALIPLVQMRLQVSKKSN